jgi:hypothetical protein
MGKIWSAELYSPLWRTDCGAHSISHLLQQALASFSSWNRGPQPTALALPINTPHVCRGSAIFGDILLRINFSQILRI